MRPTSLARFVIAAALALALFGAGPAAAADPGNEFWTPSFSPAGIQGNVNAMVSRPGVLYVGGTFTAVQDVPTPYIAALTTSASPNVAVTAVDPLGDGLDGYVYGLCEHDGDLVAVGSFVHSGDQILQHVGRWDGAAWHDLGGGLPANTPRVAVSFQGDLYAGSFRWDGAAWENVFQTNAAVTSLVVHDGLLYAGGAFTEARGDSVPYLAAWDGSQLVAAGAGFPYPVNALVSAPDGLYAAGEDDYWGYRLVSRWDGAAWNEEFTGGWVDRLATYDGDVYAATIMQTVPHYAEYVLYTNAGSTWHQVATVYPDAMAEHDGQLLVQADAGADPTLLTPGLAAFDGAALHDVFTPGGYSTGFAELAPYGAGLMVGGSYTIADGQRIAGSAIKAGDNWFPAGSPADIDSPHPASLRKLVSVGSEVFAVYQWVDWDIGVDVLAKLAWDTDGFHWQPLETPESSVGLLQPAGGQLYEFGFNELRTIDPATGVFTTVVPYVDNGGISDACDADGLLTIGGSFSVINGQPVGNVAQYVGGAWQGVGDPLPGLRVEAVTGMEPGRLAAATWTSSGVHNVWTFDGSAWTELPGDFAGTIDKVVFHRGRLFAAGSFDRIGPVWAPGVAVWTGDRWAPVGAGLRGGSYGRVSAVLSVGDKLCFAGRFTWAGGRPSAGYAEWTGDPTLFTGAPSDVPGAFASGRLLEAPRPNPFNPLTEIAFTAPTAGRVTVGVYDLRGRCVRRLADDLLPAGRHVRRWDGRDDAGRALPSGIYFALLNAGGRVESMKLALVR